MRAKKTFDRFMYLSIFTVFDMGVNINPFLSINRLYSRRFDASIRPQEYGLFNKNNIFYSELNRLFTILDLHSKH